jgi:hypothetical protein
MGTLLQQLASLSTGGKFAFAALGILLIHGIFRLLETTLPRHFRQADARYRVRKFVVFLIRNGAMVAVGDLPLRSPEAVPRARAQHARRWHQAGRACQVKLLGWASTGACDD